jgi:hypothetical protein
MSTWTAASIFSRPVEVEPGVFKALGECTGDDCLRGAALLQARALVGERSRMVGPAFLAILARKRKENED